MTVAEYARNTHREGEEITCVDSIYDTEWYAYVDDETMYDDFDYGCQMIWEHLDIVGIVDNDSGVVMVDMTGVIKEHMDELKEAELFKTYRVSVFPKGFQLISVDLGSLFTSICKVIYCCLSIHFCV